MGNISISASKLSISIQSLRDFDDALRFIRKKREIIKNDETSQKIGKLLNIISPIAEVIEGKLSKSTVMNEDNIIRILKNQYKDKWFNYKEKILQLKFKLNSSKFELVEAEYNILNDIGDAVDVECTNLFHRMREG